MGIVLSLIIAVVYAVIVGQIAKRINKSVPLWIIVCLLLPGLGTLFLALTAANQTVRCPGCGKVFKTEGRIIDDFTNRDSGGVWG